MIAKDLYNANIQNEKIRIKYASALHDIYKLNPELANELSNKANKERRAEYAKKYNENNKEKIKEYNEKNKEKIKEKNKEYNEKNKEKIKEKNKEWYEQNKEIIKEKSKEWYEQNKEKINRKYICECGSECFFRSRNKHMKSKKHINFIENKNLQ